MTDDSPLRLDLLRRWLSERGGLSVSALTDREVMERAAQLCAPALDLAYMLAGRPGSHPSDAAAIVCALRHLAACEAGANSAAAVLDRHVRHEFVDRDLEATMSTMIAEPHVNHVPTMTGGVGVADVRRFYRDHFIGKWPAYTRMTPVSRTIGVAQVVDELVVEFTHDVRMDAVLPGVAPTNRKVVLALVVIAGFRDGKITHEHIYWDQASLLVQIGLLPTATLPITGAEQARKVLDPSGRSNTLGL